MTSPSASRKMPSQTRIRGIFAVGLSRRLRLQLSATGDISAIMKRIDFGMIGVHVRNTRFPSEKTPTVNNSIKLFDRPIPM